MKPLFVISGKRKTAVAKVKVFDGKGSISYKGKDYQTLPLFHKLALREPLVLAQEVIGEVPAHFEITVCGGGKEGQIQAARLALGKALLALTRSPDLKKAYVKYDRSLLVADTRRKEPYKPGDSKARARRQKSYR
jgi:ribosomal protein S9